MAQDVLQAEKRMPLGLVASLILSISGLAISVWAVRLDATISSADPMRCRLAIPASRSGVRLPEAHDRRALDRVGQADCNIRHRLLPRDVDPFDTSTMEDASAVGSPRATAGCPDWSGPVDLLDRHRQPDTPPTHYYGLPISIGIALLLLVVTLTMLPRVIGVPWWFSGWPHRSRLSGHWPRVRREYRPLPPITCEFRGSTQHLPDWRTLRRRLGGVEMWKPFTEEEVATIWEDHQAGVPLKRIARTLGRQNSVIREYVGRTGGIRPRPRVVSELRLSQSEREEVPRGLAAGCSFGRSPGPSGGHRRRCPGR